MRKTTIPAGFYFCDLAQGDDLVAAHYKALPRLEQFNVVMVDEDGDCQCIGSEVPYDAPKALPAHWRPIRFPKEPWMPSESSCCNTSTPWFNPCLNHGPRSIGVPDKCLTCGHYMTCNGIQRQPEVQS